MQAGGIARKRGLRFIRWSALPAAVFAVTSCTTVLDYGPPRTEPPPILYRQNAEASSGAGRCGREEPPLTAALPTINTADCDSVEHPLEGKQSIRIEDKEELACDPCWPGTSTIWATFAFRIDEGDNFVAVLFETAGDAPGKALYARQTGMLLAWDPDRSLQLYCVDTPSVMVAAGVGVPYRAVFHFDWATGRGELWVGNPADAPAALTTMRPTLEISCGPQPSLPTAWGARGIVKPEPGHGAFTLDELRVAETLEDLEQ